ncbi:MAG: hypothetical protein JWQ34_372 [Mucilaginibacter sp.]|uniref:hypothetical protein n=1 Tax=Mucilaginibacter sp. TaxID=1882438 RepID=UPI00261EFBE5|nr:hypothetical protein [Mucilaginibacter sp.]MDB5002147.1 hypothetical protein [Mucilaginibacter sp.]
MTLLELKKSIHEKVDSLDDPKYLERLGSIIDKREDLLFIIPEHMLEGIRQGEQDIKNGDVYTIEDFEKKYEKWLKK